MYEKYFNKELFLKKWFVKYVLSNLDYHGKRQLTPIMVFTWMLF